MIHDPHHTIAALAVRLPCALTLTFADGEFGQSGLETLETVARRGRKIGKREQSSGDALEAADHLNRIRGAAGKFEAACGINHQLTVVAQVLAGALPGLRAVEAVVEKDCAFNPRQVFRKGNAQCIACL